MKLRYAVAFALLLLSGCATNLTLPSEGCTTDDECENNVPVVCVDYWDADKGLIPGECK